MLIRCLQVAALAVIPFALHAQRRLTSVPIDSGTLVRLTLRASPTIAGRLVQRYLPGDASLHYCRYPGPPCVNPDDIVLIKTTPTGDVSSLEVTHGTHLKKGFAIGTAIGIVLGLAGEKLSESLCNFGEGSNCSHHNHLGTMIFALSVGAFVGLLADGHPRWEPAK